MRKIEENTNDEDREAVSLCRKGDLHAFEILVNKYQMKMLNIAYRMVGSYEDACDIVQDAFISAHRGLKGFEGRARFSTWLFTIVVNLSKNRLKQLKAQRRHEGPSLDDPLYEGNATMASSLASDDPPIHEELEKSEIRKRVQDCIHALDDDFREVIILRDIQGFSYEEIGGMLRMPGGTVKSRISRARYALRDCLKKVIGEL